MQIFKKRLSLFFLCIVSACSSDSTSKNTNENETSKEEPAQDNSYSETKDTPGDLVLDFTTAPEALVPDTSQTPQFAAILGDEFALIGSQADRFNKQGVLVG